jgi:hypothetical protein
MTAVTHTVTRTREGGGHIATCTCAWLRWESNSVVLDQAIHKHIPKPAKEA